MSWDPFQRVVLAELGHAVYMPLRAGGAGDPAAVSAVDAAMLARLARAVGVDADALRLHADVAMASNALRGDAAAKRALWPRLRKLRGAARAR